MTGSDLTDGGGGGMVLLLVESRSGDGGTGSGRFGSVRGLLLLLLFRLDSWIAGNDRAVLGYYITKKK